MAKAAVTRWFVAGVTAVVVGALIVLGAVVAALAGSVFNFGGSGYVSVEDGALAWMLVGVSTLGLLAIVGGAAAVVISWIGALLNTVHLEDKIWFGVLLVSGLVGVGPLAMVAYVFAGPDGLSTDRQLPPARSGELA